MNLRIKIFDFEVFKQDWFVTFLDYDSDTYITFRNDSLSLIDFIEKNKKDTCFVGVNSNNFDIPCLTCIYNGINPYKVVDYVIKRKQKWWTIPDLKFKPKPTIISYDILAGAKEDTISLKEAEGNMGMNIKEMNFDTEFGGKLPDDIYKRLLDYNKHDCLATKEWFIRIYSKYEAKKRLLEMFDMDYTCMSMTYPLICAKIFNASEIPQLESFNYKAPKQVNIKTQGIVSEFENHIYLPPKEDDLVFVRNIQDCVVTLAAGGGHGCIENFIYELKDDEVFLTADVDSLYPNLMIKYNYLSRCIPDKLGYTKIVNDRLEFKRKGMKLEADAYKEIINPLYGASRQFLKTPNGDKKPGKLCDWVKGTENCITGQLFLWMMAEMCDLPTTRHFNLNTDGLYTIVDKDQLENVKAKLAEWQNITGLSLSIGIIEKGGIYQKDVNNYILYDAVNDKVKCKGSFVNKWQGGSIKSNSCSIIDEAVVKYFVYKKPINETIQEAFDKNEVIKFQMIVARKGKNYTATMWGDQEVQKVNRVFPTFDESKPMLTKVKNGVKNKFQNIPEHCYVDNRDVSEIQLKDIKLDLMYYINATNKRIKDFKEGK